VYKIWTICIWAIKQCLHKTKSDEQNCDESFQFLRIFFLDHNFYPNNSQYVAAKYDAQNLGAKKICLLASIIPNSHLKLTRNRLFLVGSHKHWGYPLEFNPQNSSQLVIIFSFFYFATNHPSLFWKHLNDLPRHELERTKNDWKIANKLYWLLRQS